MDNKLSDLEKKQIEFAHLGLDLTKVDFDKLRNPFANYHSAEYYEEILHVIRDPQNFYFTAKHILNVELDPFQVVCLQELWVRTFPMLIGTRGMSKTFMLAVYCLLRALITQGCSIVITSASFRQAKFVIDYIQTIWQNAPVLRDLIGTEKPMSMATDNWVFKIGDSKVIAIPMGDGKKIRGLRANYIICEEFGSVNQQIFEEVISGFAASASSPIENIKRIAKIKKLKEMNLWSPEVAAKLEGTHKPNQVVISGTATWAFTHFAKYWREYRAIIRSHGDPAKLREAMGDKWSDKLDWKDYSIIRIPLDIIPEGMMDEKNIARAMGTTTTGIADNEYHAIFSKDSNGFYPRTLIESCVCKQPILMGSESIQFPQRIYGDSSRKYVYGIDPASESDNFAVVIVEVHNTHIRVVYCWTTSRLKAFNRFKAHANPDNAFYSYISRKIRALMKVFPCEHIALDSGGGGVLAMEALHDLRSLEAGEIPIWPIQKDHPLFWPGSKDYMYDGEAGLHLIEMVSMSKNDYVVEANHGMKKDLQNKMLLFPYADGVSIMSANCEDVANDREYDTLEDCIMEIEELKEELSTIAHTTTQNGTDRWETPEIILPGNKRGRMRKDRYSALMMANAAARRLLKQSTITYNEIPAGGFVSRELAGKDFKGQALYQGPSWFVEKANRSILGRGINPGNAR